MLAELLSWKEASIHPSPVPEPVPALGPDCQLLFLQTFSAPGASAGVCSDATLHQTSEANQTHDNSNLYPRWSPLSIQPIWSLILTQWVSHISSHLAHTPRLLSLSTIPTHHFSSKVSSRTACTYPQNITFSYQRSGIMALLLWHSCWKFKNQNTPRVNGCSWLHTRPRPPLPTTTTTTNTQVTDKT